MVKVTVTVSNSKGNGKGLAEGKLKKGDRWQRNVYSERQERMEEPKEGCIVEIEARQTYKGKTEGLIYICIYTCICMYIYIYIYVYRYVYILI